MDIARLSACPELFTTASWRRLASCATARQPGCPQRNDDQQRPAGRDRSDDYVELVRWFEMTPAATPR